MDKDQNQLEAELANVEQAIHAQEALRGILTDEQLETTLATLRKQRDSIQATLLGSGAIAQDGGVAAGAGGVAVGRDVLGDVIVVADPNLLWRDIRRRPPPAAARPPGHGYNIAAVRNLLRDAFTAGDLRRFCQDRPTFRPILDHFGPKFSFEEMVGTVIEQCEAQDMIPDLLAEVQTFNPRQYRRHAAYLQERPMPQETTEPGAPPGTPVAPAPVSRDLQRATERYLEHLVDRYRYLEFRGMGISDKVALRLPLVEMYVPLKARIEMPEGETWARSLHLAGREVSAEEAEAIGARLSEPRPALDLLREHDGLIVLGDPGAGKTTFLKYLALMLAAGQGDELGLGARLPVLLPLSAYALALDKGDVPLHRFIAGYYRDRGVDLPLGSMLDEALAQGGALLLLDGLDEVRDLARRHLVVQRVVDFLSFHRRRGNKFILTSRIVGYREVRPMAEGLAECTLVDFDEEEIGLFVEKWTGALERAARGDTPVAAQEAAREREELLASVQRNPGVRRLAANPLLLTILALMKRQGVTLPERRVELYQKYVETLLKHWNLARGLGRPPSRDLDVVETVRVLAPLALWMHETSPGVGLVKREDMRRRLVEIYAGRGVDGPERAARQLLADAREHAGLLLERGAGQYGFIHLTFQEYLAGVAIALKGQQGIEPVVEALAAHVGDDNWHEVSLLAVGYLGIIQQRDEAAGDALWALIQEAPGEPGQAAVLAGEAVADAWPGGVTPACKGQVVEVLLATMAESVRVKPGLRAASGRVLSRLGDPRAEVLTVEAMQFCYIPPGPFWMGEGEGEHRNEHLDYDYWIGRYPVTSAQYRAFVDTGGYGERQYWTEAGWQWREREEIAGPFNLGEAWNLPNHPVVAVSWYEAVAYCRWLTERVGGLPEKYEVRLPSEAEWEKAGRGGEEIPAEPVVASAGAVGAAHLRENPSPKRRYPWGDEPDPNRANYDETAVGTTSAVGCFPGGVSPYGAEDLAGNVWEWTRSLWGKSFGEPEFRYPYDPRDGRENWEAGDEVRRVLRGGSFYNLQGYVRCADRDNYYPYSRARYDGFRCVVAPAASER